MTGVNRRRVDKGTNPLPARRRCGLLRRVVLVGQVYGLDKSVSGFAFQAASRNWVLSLIRWRSAH